MKASRLVLGVFGPIWLLLIGAGFLILMNYEYTPGERGLAPVLWPTNCSIKRKASGTTLLMFVHPKCPCTKASITELSKIMTKRNDKVNAYLLFLTPKSVQGWDNSDNKQLAEKIIGVTILSDIDGLEAERFHSKTSGDVLAYDTGGRLIYSGGITGARGQIGDNQGAQSLILALDKQAGKFGTACVFGCALTNRGN